MGQPKEREFLRHVKAHQMEVIRDDGLHRHLRFKNPKTSNQYFDLITWPGSLCYTGDMGTFVFSRAPDMFGFFRSDYPDNKLHINPSYWAEKLDAADRRTGGADEYSPDKFRAQVKQWLTSGEASKEIRAQVKDRVLSCADDGEYWAMRAATEFEHNGFRLSDFWEASLREYTYHFVWCCFAIIWAIKQYDTQRESASVAA